MLVEFLDSYDKWDELLKGSVYDFYQIPGFLKLEADYAKHEPIYFYYENNEAKALIPLLKREISGLGKQTYYDLISPYGYPGIVVNRHFNYQEFNQVSAAFLEKSKEEKYVSAFLRLNPLTNNFIFNQTNQIQQKIHGNTIFLDLNDDIDELRKSYSSNHRRNIRKLNKNGFTATVDHWDDYKDWQHLYIDTMKRLNASPYYLYSEEYFDAFRKALGDRLHLISLYNPDGELCAGGLFSTFGEVIQYHLGGTHESYLNDAPTKLMFDFAAEWGQENQYKILHLGGGLGSEEDSLFHFKKGFSNNLLTFSTMRFVTLPEVYNNLVNLNFKDKPEEKEKNNQFFPLYRFQID